MKMKRKPYNMGIEKIDRFSHVLWNSDAFNSGDIFSHVPDWKDAIRKIGARSRRQYLR